MMVAFSHLFKIYSLIRRKRRTYCNKELICIFKLMANVERIDTFQCIKLNIKNSMYNTELSVHYMFKRIVIRAAIRLRLLVHKFQEHTWPTTHDRRIQRNTDINVGYIMYPHWHSRIRYTCNPYFAGSFFE